MRVLGYLIGLQKGSSRGEAAGFVCRYRRKIRWRAADVVCDLLIVAGVMWVVLHRSVYGRYLFAVGRNEAAARYSGINSRWVIMART